MSERERNEGTDAIQGDAGREYVRVEGTDIVLWSEVREYYLNFRAVGIVAWDVDGNPCDYGHGTDDMKPTPDEAEKYLEGSIKWDGCSNLCFGEEGDLHLCGGRYWAELARLLEYLWREAQKIPKWDPEIADADAFAVPSTPTPEPRSER